MTKAPDIPNSAWPKGGYPTKGKKLGPAWTKIWRSMERFGDFQDGIELAAKIAKSTDLAPATLVALMSRAATAGLLERKLVKVPTARGPRIRSFYKISESKGEMAEVS